jgi:hypothetical protein
MQEHHGRSIPGSFVQVVDPELPALEIVDLHIVGCKGVAREVLEALVGCAKGLHGLGVSCRQLVIHFI